MLNVLKTGLDLRFDPVGVFLAFHCDPATYFNKAGGVGRGKNGLAAVKPGLCPVCEAPVSSRMSSTQDAISSSDVVLRAVREDARHDGCRAPVGIFRL